MIYLLAMLFLIGMIGITIYLLFLLPPNQNSNKYIKDYYVSILTKYDFDLLFNLYYNIWEVEKFRRKNYNNDYDNYKISLYYTYLEIYSILQTLKPIELNNLLLDMKNGVLRQYYIQPQNTCKLFNLRFYKYEIDEIIYNIFSSNKLNQQEFYDLLKL